MGAEHQTRMVEAARAKVKGSKRSDDFKKNLSLKMKSRVISDETRAKMSEAQRKRYAKTDA